VVWPLLGLLMVMGFVWFGWWIWTAFVLLLGVEHPRVIDEEVPLDQHRAALGWIAIAIFILCFMPLPIEQIG